MFLKLSRKPRIKTLVGMFIFAQLVTLRTLTTLVLILQKVQIQNFLTRHWNALRISTRYRGIKVVKSWTYNWKRLTTLLSIFLFCIHLLICLNVSIYILIIYKWSKIRAWFAFRLNINEVQPLKYIRKKRDPVFLDSASFFEFPASRRVWNRFINLLLVYNLLYFS